MGSIDPVSATPTTAEVNDDYDQCIAGGFAPLPVALVSAHGSLAYDVEHKSYIDFLSMIAVNNMGHGHPKIVDAAVKALQSGATVNLAFQSPFYGRLARRLTQAFGYDRFVALTSGGEAADASMKIARKWGHLVKGIPVGKCFILSASGCYHGVGLSPLSLASKKSRLFETFLPQTGSTSPSGISIRYGCLEDVEMAFKLDGTEIAAFIVEPIQGAAGVIVPPDDYLPGVARLCRQYNVLLIADEIQTGLGRCGYPLFHMKYGIRPDLVILGKALSGGVYPVSGVLGDNHIMKLLDPYEVGSTMAANPPGCAASLAAIDVLFDEGLSSRALMLGDLLISTLKSSDPPHVKEYMGAGLLWAIVIKEKPPRVTSRRVIALLAQRGVLANAIKGGRIRICPPLTISTELLLQGVEIIVQTLRDVESHLEGLPGEVVTIKYPIEPDK
ncbi:ornithine-oxo-acid transaminase [Fonsecaea erecta]|uniref:Ornithine aminotransferase n=1 Tax=Fonsecaea erecta TaxID=1367422 RepID=A0A178ZDS4_9EURO|nr:ornithine-oxo-acid transaminase [Fonsecaea erecta]OAP57616.1 ornithine-oxo-acid transaminase [Fonsecaea erecta]